MEDVSGTDVEAGEREISDEGVADLVSAKLDALDALSAPQSGPESTRLVTVNIRVLENRTETLRISYKAQ